jgi:hypothetical protein
MFQFYEFFKGSSPGHTGRTFKGFVELKHRFLSILMHLQLFQIYGTFFEGSGKSLFFRVYTFWTLDQLKSGF